MSKLIQNKYKYQIANLISITVTFVTIIVILMVTIFTAKTQPSNHEFFSQVYDSSKYKVFVGVSHAIYTPAFILSIIFSGISAAICKKQGQKVPFILYIIGASLLFIINFLLFVGIKFYVSFLVIVCVFTVISLILLLISIYIDYFYPNLNNKQVEEK